MIQSRSNCAWPLPACQRDEEVSGHRPSVQRKWAEQGCCRGRPFPLCCAVSAVPVILCLWQCCVIHPLRLTVSLRSVIAWLPHCTGAPFLSLTLLKSLEATIPECLSSSLKSVLTLTPPGCDHCLSRWAFLPASLPCWLFMSPGTFWCSQHTGRAPHAHLDAPSPLRGMFLVPPPSVPTCFKCWL